jgi:hypothetical protein
MGGGKMKKTMARGGAVKRRVGGKMKKTMAKGGKTRR